MHITSRTKEGLEAAVARIEELIQQELPQLVDERRFRRRDQEALAIERDEYGRVSLSHPTDAGGSGAWDGQGRLTHDRPAA